MIKVCFDSYTRIPRAIKATGGKVIEECAWMRVAQRGGRNVFSFSKGRQDSNPVFGRPLIVDGEGGLKVDEVFEHLGGNCASRHHPGCTEVPKLGVHRFIEA